MLYHSALKTTRRHTKRSLAMCVQFRLYDDFAHRISDIQSDLARTRNLVEDAIQGNSQDGIPKSLDTPTWTGMTATQIRVLNDFVEDLNKYSALLSNSESGTKSIETAQSGARELSIAFDSARDHFDLLVKRRSNSTTVTDDIDTQEEDLRKLVDHLWYQYDTAKQSMLSVGDDLLRAAATESESANQLAKQCEHLSWVPLHSWHTDHSIWTYKECSRHEEDSCSVMDHSVF